MKLEIGQESKTLDGRKVTIVNIKENNVIYDIENITKNSVCDIPTFTQWLKDTGQWKEIE
jgi:hypothetical protein